MLKYYYPKLIQNKFIQRLNKFFYSNYYIILVNILMLISYYFSLEILIYYVYMILGIYIMFFCDDMLPTVPMFCTGYMTVSRINNPITNPNTLLKSKTFAINLIIIGTIIGIGLLMRLITSIKHQDKANKPKLTNGFIAISICMMFGGIFTKYYSIKSFLYGLLVGLSLSFCYFYFFYTIDFKKVRKDYLAFTFMFIGLAVGIEVLESYFIINYNQEFHRNNIITGWGIYNNIGGIICTCIGAPLYLASCKKNSFIYTIIAIILYLFTILSQSRNAIIIGTLLLIIGLILVIINSKDKERLYNILTISIFLIASICIMIIFRNEIKNVFSDLINIGLDNNGRFSQYKNGLKAFILYPFTGTGFYDYDHAINIFLSSDSFLAPRYHNTIIQFLASTGILGIIFYLYHRWETIKLTVHKCSLEKIFFAICLCAIILNSLLDCQFFNFGPGLHYGTLLVFIECINLSNESKELYTNDI